MQTFLPYRDFRKSAEVLDQRRLGKQRVETLQLLKSLTLPDYGWKNHPASKMWRGYEEALILYGIVICQEWIKRGYNDSCLPQIVAFDTARRVVDLDHSAVDLGEICYTNNAWKMPPWLDRKFCRSHQSNLLKKDPVFYGQKFPNVPDNLPYVWPV